MPTFSEETGEIFQNNPDKQIIYQKSQENILKSLKTASDHPIVQERHNLALGSTFEILASNELIEHRLETKQQRDAREIVEYLFQNADILTGKEKLSKPDFVSVIFNNRGQMVIDEIVEFKTSAVAFEKKMDRQPQHSIYTIDSIVSIMNSMISAGNFADLEIAKGLETNAERNNFLKETFAKIKSANFQEHITFSENLKYHVRIPKGEFITPPRLNLWIGHAEKQRRVILRFSNSSFTKRNCYDIIDHYQETP